MVCTYCRQQTQVINSRLQKKLNQVWRRRKCLNCQAVFSTLEKIDLENSWVVKDKKNNISSLSRDRLFLSIYKSCQHRRQTALEDADGLTQTVIQSLLYKESSEIMVEDIIKNTTEVLKRFDSVASTHYIAYHKNR